MYNLKENTIMDIGIYLAATSAVKYMLLYVNDKKIPSKARIVGKVVGLNAYPVKSMKGLNVDQLECTTVGVNYGDLYDRHWIVTTDDYECCNGKKEPMIATVRTSLHGDEFWLETDSCTPLKLPVNPNCSKLKAVWVRYLGQFMFGFDFGEEASAWITRFLQRSVSYRVVYCPCGKESRYFRKGANPLLNKLAALTDFSQVCYHDGVNCSMISQASLADLNQRLETPVSMQNFRMNVTVGDCKPYAEDKWQEIFINDARFSTRLLAIRCLFTTVDPETGIRHPNNEPFRTLSSYRLLSPISFVKHVPVFGIFLCLERPGKIHVGDDVYAITEEEHNF